MGPPAPGRMVTVLRTTTAAAGVAPSMMSTTHTAQAGRMGAFRSRRGLLIAAVLVIAVLFFLALSNGDISTHRITGGGGPLLLWLSSAERERLAPVAGIAFFTNVAQPPGVGGWSSANVSRGLWNPSMSRDSVLAGDRSSTTQPERRGSFRLTAASNSARWRPDGRSCIPGMSMCEGMRTACTTLLRRVQQGQRDLTTLTSKLMGKPTGNASTSGSDRGSGGQEGLIRGAQARLDRLTAELREIQPLCLLFPCGAWAKGSWWAEASDGPTGIIGRGGDINDPTNMSPSGEESTRSSSNASSPLGPPSTRPTGNETTTTGDRPTAAFGRVTAADQKAATATTTLRTATMTALDITILGMSLERQYRVRQRCRRFTGPPAPPLSHQRSSENDRGSRRRAVGIDDRFVNPSAAPSAQVLPMCARFSRRDDKASKRPRQGGIGAALVDGTAPHSSTAPFPELLSYDRSYFDGISQLRHDAPRSTTTMNVTDSTRAASESESGPSTSSTATCDSPRYLTGTEALAVLAARSRRRCPFRIVTGRGRQEKTRGGARRPPPSKSFPQQGSRCATAGDIDTALRAFDASNSAVVDLPHQSAAEGMAAATNRSSRAAPPLANGSPEIAVGAPPPSSSSLQTTTAAAPRRPPPPKRQPPSLRMMPTFPRPIVFTGDSIVRQLFQRTVFLIRGTGLGAPSMEVSVHGDFCYVAFEDGDRLVSMYDITRRYLLTSGPERMSSPSPPAAGVANDGTDSSNVEAAAAVAGMGQVNKAWSHVALMRYYAATIARRISGLKPSIGDTSERPRRRPTASPTGRTTTPTTRPSDGTGEYFSSSPEANVDLCTAFARHEAALRWLTTMNASSNNDSGMSSIADEEAAWRPGKNNQNHSATNRTTNMKRKTTTKPPRRRVVPASMLPDRYLPPPPLLVMVFLWGPTSEVWRMDSLLAGDAAITSPQLPPLPVIRWLQRRDRNDSSSSSSSAQSRRQRPTTRENQQPFPQDGVGGGENEDDDGDNQAGQDDEGKGAPKQIEALVNTVADDDWGDAKEEEEQWLSSPGTIDAVGEAAAENSSNVSPVPRRRRRRAPDEGDPDLDDRTVSRRRGGRQSAEDPPTPPPSLAKRPEDNLGIALLVTGFNFWENLLHSNFKNSMRASLQVSPVLGASSSSTLRRASGPPASPDALSLMNDASKVGKRLRRLAATISYDEAAHHRRLAAHLDRGETVVVAESSGDRTNAATVEAAYGEPITSAAEEAPPPRRANTNERIDSVLGPLYRVLTVRRAPRASPPPSGPATAMINKSSSLPMGDPSSVPSSAAFAERPAPGNPPPSPPLPVAFATPLLTQRQRMQLVTDDANFLRTADALPSLLRSSPGVGIFIMTTFSAAGSYTNRELAAAGEPQTTVPPQRISNHSESSPPRTNGAADGVSEVPSPSGEGDKTSSESIGMPSNRGGGDGKVAPLEGAAEQEAGLRDELAANDGGVDEEDEEIGAAAAARSGHGNGAAASLSRKSGAINDGGDEDQIHQSNKTADHSAGALLLIGPNGTTTATRYMPSYPINNIESSASVAPTPSDEAISPEGSDEGGSETTQPQRRRVTPRPGPTSSPAALTHISRLLPKEFLRRFRPETTTGRRRLQQLLDTREFITPLMPMGVRLSSDLVYEDLILQVKNDDVRKFVFELQRAAWMKLETTMQRSVEQLSRDLLEEEARRWKWNQGRGEGEIEFLKEERSRQNRLTRARGGTAGRKNHEIVVQDAAAELTSGRRRGSEDADDIELSSFCMVPHLPTSVAVSVTRPASSRSVVEDRTHIVDDDTNARSPRPDGQGTRRRLVVTAALPWTMNLLDFYGLSEMDHGRVFHRGDTYHYGCRMLPSRETAAAPAKLQLMKLTAPRNAAAPPPSSFKDAYDMMQAARKAARGQPMDGTAGRGGGDVASHKRKGGGDRGARRGSRGRRATSDERQGPPCARLYTDRATRNAHRCDDDGNLAMVQHWLRMILAGA